MRLVFRIKRKLATPFLRRLLRRPSHVAAREALARIYLKGNGVEVGALNVPLRVPDGVRVIYADTKPANELQLNCPEEAVHAPDIFSDLETMRSIDDASLDFVIANHVLEHVENPLGALRAVSRVLCCGGVAFITLPDKRFTFDKRRAITPLSHIIVDFEDGPETSRRGHYADWALNVERVSRAAVAARVQALEAGRANIHFHVWDYPSMKEMFTYACPLSDISFRVEHVQENRGEVIWILRKIELAR